MKSYDESTTHSLLTDLRSEKRAPHPIIPERQDEGNQSSRAFGKGDDQWNAASKSTVDTILSMFQGTLVNSTCIPIPFTDIPECNKNCCQLSIMYDLELAS